MKRLTVLAALLLPFSLAAGCSASSSLQEIEYRRCAVQYTGHFADGQRVIGLACIPEPGNT